MNMGQQDKNVVVDFTKTQFINSGAKTLILGVSGGIDSTLMLAIAIAAVGAENVRAYSLPYFWGLYNTDNVKKICDHYNVDFETINIKPIVDSYRVLDSYRLGNIMARVRMTLLYDKALEHKGLVLNTCNLSEDLVGYATKFGDAAGDLAPIAHLTKTEVYKMSEIFEIPEKFINRTPSAELWSGQTDEDELGFSYEDLDDIINDFVYDNDYLELYPALYYWMEDITYDRYISEYDTDVKQEVWDRILLLNKNSQHKLIPIPNLIF